MKHFALLASAVILIGCADTVDSSKTAMTTPEPASEPAEMDPAPTMTVSFEAGASANLAIPEMHCPFGCFPKAQDALAKLDGIAGVELVKQEEEGVINDRRVVVSFDGEVDSQAAIAALDAVGFEGSSFEQSETSDN